jgi:predicted dehydrogenase
VPDPDSTTFEVERETPDTAVVGIGSFEQHALHLPPQTDLLFAAWVSYDMAKRSSRDGPKFGTGIEEGLIAAERGLRAFDSLEAMLGEVEVVHVCVPPALHEPVTVAALERGVHTIVEKPFTGCFGSPRELDKERMLEEALASARRMLAAEKKGPARIYYAENWVFAPVIQKEAEILRKTGAQALWIVAEESHSGSHSPTYGTWSFSGGGSLMGKGCHPLTAALHLKRLEGQARGGLPIRPRAVSARTHELTRLPGYRNVGYLRTDYTDVEDFGLMHVLFEDGTVADIFCSEIVLGGVHNWLEVFANNHRTRCNINPDERLRPGAAALLRLHRAGKGELLGVRPRLRHRGRDLLRLPLGPAKGAGGGAAGGLTGAVPLAAGARGGRVAHGPPV